MKLKTILKYLPFVVGSIMVFFAGRCTAPTEDKELKRKFELERKTLLDDVKLREARIIDREAQAKEIVSRMKEDSIKFSIELQAKNKAIFKLEKYYASISFRDADGAKLDSLLSVLY